MHRKLISWVTCAFCIIAFSICGSATVEAKSQDAEIINLKVATWNPPQLAISKVEKKWAEKIEAQSGGRVKFTFYWAAALAKPNDAYKTAKAGVADIIYWVIGFNPGVTPLNEVFQLPFLGSDSMAAFTKVHHELNDKFPQLEEEIGLKTLMAAAMPPYQFHFTKKEVQLPEEIAGLKLIVGAAAFDMARELKIVPVQKGPTDWYMSLQRGLVEGQIVHFPAVRAFKCTELYATHTLAGTGGIQMSLAGLFMNPNAWNKLPADIQKIIMDLKPWVEDEHVRTDVDELAKAEGEAREMGHKMIELTPQEIDLWRKATSPVHEQWIKKQEEAGRPVGREMYNELMRLIPKYNNN